MASPFLLSGLLLVLVLTPRARGLWITLLGWEGGRFWPVPAALLPPMLAVSSRLGTKLPVAYQVASASLLLMAIAVLQIYGQARAERYKQLADAEIGRIATGVREQGSLIRGIAADVGRIADGVASGDEG
ncbi:hypothetical protein KBY84_12710 [Cyanobium sp. N.Huapi 1H5]|nr:hypothetical protein [Cyanobium sp. N.Huapi 1H5]